MPSAPAAASLSSAKNAQRKRIDRDMMEERRQTFLWLPAYELPYPVGRL